MSPRMRGRSAPCNLDDARIRLRHADSFLFVADLVREQADDPLLALSSVAASLAVLAGIAASDAACCAALKQRARGQDHEEAVALLQLVNPGGDQLARDLRRLLGLKGNAQYGMLILPGDEAESAVTWARRLVAGARQIVAAAP